MILMDMMRDVEEQRPVSSTVWELNSMRCHGIVTYHESHGMGAEMYALDGEVYIHFGSRADCADMVRLGKGGYARMK